MTCEFQALRDCVSVHLVNRKKDVSGPSADPGGKQGTHRAELPQLRCPQTEAEPAAPHRGMSKPSLGQPTSHLLT